MLTRVARVDVLQLEVSVGGFCGVPPGGLEVRQAGGMVRLTVCKDATRESATDIELGGEVARGGGDVGPAMQRGRAVAGDVVEVNVNDCVCGSNERASVKRALSLSLVPSIHRHLRSRSSKQSTSQVISVSVYALILSPSSGVP